MLTSPASIRRAKKCWRPRWAGARRATTDKKVSGPAQTFLLPAIGLPGKNQRSSDAMLRAISHVSRLDSRMPRERSARS